MLLKQNRLRDILEKKDPFTHPTQGPHILYVRSSKQAPQGIPCVF